MKLFFETTPLLSAETGIGRYTRQIALATAKDARFETCFSPSDPTRASTVTKDHVERIKHALRPYPLLYQGAKTLFRSLRSLRSHLAKKRYDCYFEPNFILRSDVLAKKHIATVHDLSCFRFPEWHPKERVDYMQKHFTTSLERCDKIITVSQAIAYELTLLFNVPSKGIAVIHNGVDHTVFYRTKDVRCRDVCASLHLPSHFIVHVGTLEPRKNLKSLLTAYAQLSETLQRRFPLLLVGASGWENNDLYGLIRKNSHVRYIGFVTDQVLAALYNLASVMVYPSWYEGFGLPVLEAMACGCPVLTSTDPALLEVSGQAALHAEASDCDALRAKLELLLLDEEMQENMRSAGIERAKAFSWQKSAKMHLNLFAALGADVCTN